jgi:pimeloyl-ACP methyl ester carboxylesterase
VSLEESRSHHPRVGALHGRTPAGPHRIAYLEWGDPGAHDTVVCVHGLTGRARDFDALATALADAGHRVVCPDVVGRGDSDRLADPSGYELRQYVSDMRALLAHLGVSEVDWVGTSMGGLIGMALAASSPSPVRRLVLNDIGHFVPTAALQRLDAYTGSDPTFADLTEAEAYLRLHYAPFGALTDEQWARMARQRARPREGGGYGLHYDPAIAVNLHATAHRDADLWRLWDEIACQVLALRGAESDLFPQETVAEMATRGPGVEVIEFADCGHAPPLLERSQIAPVVAWLATGGEA